MRARGAARAGEVARKRRSSRQVGKEAAEECYGREKRYAHHRLRAPPHKRPEIARQAQRSECARVRREEMEEKRVYPVVGALNHDAAAESVLKRLYIALYYQSGAH